MIPINTMCSKFKFFIFFIVNILKFFPIYLINFFYYQIQCRNYHLHLFMPLWGTYYYLAERKLHKTFLLFILFYVWSFLPALINLNISSIRYSLEGILMVGFLFFLVDNFTKHDYKKLLVMIFIFSIGYYFFEFFLLMRNGIKELFPGILFPFARLDGIAGYSNMSGMLFATISIIFLHISVHFIIQ